MGAKLGEFSKEDMLINEITKEEDEAIRMAAEELCQELLNIPYSQHVRYYLELAYLKGKVAGERGIVKSLKDVATRTRKANKR